MLPIRWPAILVVAVMIACPIRVATQASFAQGVGMEVFLTGQASPWQSLIGGPGRTASAGETV